MQQFGRSTCKASAHKPGNTPTLSTDKLGLGPSDLSDARQLHQLSVAGCGRMVATLNRCNDLQLICNCFYYLSTWTKIRFWQTCRVGLKFTT